MSDEVSARRIPSACEIAVMNDLFVCADHEAEARASLASKSV